MGDTLCKHSEIVPGIFTEADPHTQECVLSCTLDPGRASDGELARTESTQ